MYGRQLFHVSISWLHTLMWMDFSQSNTPVPFLLPLQLVSFMKDSSPSVTFGSDSQ